MRRRAALVTLALAIAACSSSDRDADAPTATESSADAEDGSGVAATAPVEVAIERETGTAATGTVGPEGGAVAATGSDGTEYALQVPPGALPQPVEITITPLASMTGLPDGAGLAFGAALEPDGLTFAVPTWLYVRADDDPAQVFSGFGIKGDEVRLRGIGFDGERFVVPVGAFSGAGAGTCIPRCGGGIPGWPGLPDTPGGPGTPGGGPIQPPGPNVPPWDPPGGDPPGPPGGDGDLGSGSPGGGLGGSLTDGLDGGSPAGGGLDGEIGDAVTDLGEAQLTGDEEGEARARNRMRNLRERARGEAIDAGRRCIEERDLGSLEELLHWWQVTQLLEAHDDVDEDADQEELQAVFDACNRFELDAIGSFEFHLGGDVISMGDEIDLSVPLVFDGGQWAGSATGPVPNFGFDRGVELIELLGFGLGAAMGIDVPNDIRQNDHIQCSSSPASGTLEAMVANLFADSGPQLVLTMSAAGDATVSCPDPIGAFTVPPLVVDLPLHVESGFPGAGDFGLVVHDGWTLGEGTPLATRDLHHEIDSEGIRVVIGWHFTIEHAPGTMPAVTAPRPDK